tara:strand:+ start:684 stop:866 length:183 start_codon:yes stop_codon:yes gene_type:complete
MNNKDLTVIIKRLYEYEYEYEYGNEYIQESPKKAELRLLGQLNFRNDNFLKNFTPVKLTG